jgi:hypothetical protein
LAPRTAASVIALDVLVFDWRLVDGGAESTLSTESRVEVALVVSGRAKRKGDRRLPG